MAKGKTAVGHHGQQHGDMFGRSTDCRFSFVCRGRTIAAGRCSGFDCGDGIVWPPWLALGTPAVRWNGIVHKSYTKLPETAQITPNNPIRTERKLLIPNNRNTAMLICKQGSPVRSRPRPPILIVAVTSLLSPRAQGRPALRQSYGACDADHCFGKRMPVIENERCDEKQTQGSADIPDELAERTQTVRSSQASYQVVYVAAEAGRQFSPAISFAIL
jgi:hypothetical protein